MPNKVRDKGLRYERKWRKIWDEDLGFPGCTTTRFSSRLLDGLKVDLDRIPVNFQCKAVNSSINYGKLIAEIKSGLQQDCPERSELPTIISHKRNGRKEEDELIVMTAKDFLKLAALIKWQE